jgi:hypothetical protein
MGTDFWEEIAELLGQEYTNAIDRVSRTLPGITSTVGQYANRRIRFESICSLRAPWMVGDDDPVELIFRVFMGDLGSSWDEVEFDVWIDGSTALLSLSRQHLPPEGHSEEYQLSIRSYIRQVQELLTTADEQIVAFLRSRQPLA